MIRLVVAVKRRQVEVMSSKQTTLQSVLASFIDELLMNKGWWYCVPGKVPAAKDLPEPHPGRILPHMGSLFGLTEMAQNHGERVGLIMNRNNGDPKLLAFVWMDRDRRYFNVLGSSLVEGKDYVLDHWEQLNQ